MEFRVHSKAETADESAQNMDMEPEKIIKTLVFKAGSEFVAVLCPGDRKVSEKKLREVTGEKVRMARPGEVKDETGYVVGGVSPFDLDLEIYMEEEILDHQEVKPAAGSRVVGVEIDPEELKKAISAEALEISS